MKQKQSASRFVRTIRTLLLISLLGIGLGLYNAYTARRDTQIALGPESDQQRQFFIQAAERPDLAVFFKGLEPEQRVTMARNLGRYRDPELAKLIGIVLADFHAPAREELTKSLTQLAKAQPKAVAEQLKLTGSFQKLGVLHALSEIGPSAVPMVVEQLSVGDARSNAVAYLVEVGKPAVEPLIKTLLDKDVEVRKAAADALGKIHSLEAIPQLIRLYQTSEGDEQVAYLAALSAIGAPSTEDLFVANIDNESYPLPRRSLAALGLGRIGSERAAKELWQYADHPDLDFRGQIISALQLAGDTALTSPAAKPAFLLQVAQHVPTAKAQDLIQRALAKNPTTEAVRAAQGRESLAPRLITILRGTDPNEDGEIMDAIIQTLATTQSGKSELSKLRNDPYFAGFVLRHQRLSG